MLNVLFYGPGSTEHVNVEFVSSSCQHIVCWISPAAAAAQEVLLLLLGLWEKTIWDSGDIFTCSSNTNKNNI